MCSGGYVFYRYMHLGRPPNKIERSLWRTDCSLNWNLQPAYRVDNAIMTLNYWLSPVALNYFLMGFSICEKPWILFFFQCWGFLCCVIFCFLYFSSLGCISNMELRRPKIFLNFRKGNAHTDRKKTTNKPTKTTNNKNNTNISLLENILISDSPLQLIRQGFWGRALGICRRMVFNAFF